MERVYVLEPGAYLRKEDGNLAVVRHGRTVERVAFDGLKTLTVMGYGSLSGAVLKALVQHRVETVLLSPTGRFEARLVLDEHKHVERRRAQYLVLSNPARTAQIARSIVAGKLRAQARFLLLRGQQYDDERLLAAGTAIRALERGLPAQPSLELVRGAEGHGSRIYFGVFGLLVRNPAFTFTGRTRRPPRDPINALISYVSTVLTAEVLSAISRVGLDPYLGALHEVAYGRPSLACDLVEEWRTFVADRLVLGLVNRRAVSPEGFILRSAPEAFAHEDELTEKRPVSMKPGTIRALMESYDTWMTTRTRDPMADDHTTLRELILRQVRRFAAHLTGEAPEYRPFPWELVR